MKEIYVKPEIATEVLKPGALAGSGSDAAGGDPGDPGGGDFNPIQILNPLFGWCCD